MCRHLIANVIPLNILLHYFHMYEKLYFFTNLQQKRGARTFRQISMFILNYPIRIWEHYSSRKETKNRQYIIINDYSLLFDNFIWLRYVNWWTMLKLIGDNQSLPGLIKSERPKSISFMSESSPPEVKRKFCSSNNIE